MTQLLIKDPELHSKIWRIDVPPYAAMAEVVARFLMRRSNGALVQPCLLKISFCNKLLTSKDLLRQTLPELGIPPRGAILSANWAISAGHIAKDCPECRFIADVANSISRSLAHQATPAIVPAHADAPQQETSVQPSAVASLDEGAPITAPEASDSQTAAVRGVMMTPDGNAHISRGSAGSPTTGRKQREGKTAMRGIQRSSKAGLNPMEATGNGFGGLANNGILTTSRDPTTLASVELIRSLERMITVCMQENVVEKLERLTSLHKNGDLSYQEFCRAKSKLLEAQDERVATDSSRRKER